jgi:hypothetical protein
MVDAGFFGHQSPTTGVVDDRARANGLRLGLLGENVAKAPSIGEAHALLLGSPGHRDNILNPRFSHVGIGVVREHAAEPRVFAVTEMFAALPEPIADPAASATAAFAAILEARRAASAPKAGRVRALDALALEMAARVAADSRADPGAIASEVARPFVQRSHRGIPLILIAFPADPREVAADPRLSDPKHAAFGVAVVRGPASDARRTNVVVVLASP